MDSLSLTKKTSNPSWQFFEGLNNSETSADLTKLARSAQKSLEILEIWQNRQYVFPSFDHISTN